MPCFAGAKHGIFVLPSDLTPPWLHKKLKVAYLSSKSSGHVQSLALSVPLFFAAVGW